VIDSTRLLADTKALVRTLVDDLRTLAATDPDTAGVVEGEHRRAQAAGRTAQRTDVWAEDLYAQVAVAWVLGAVFVRFCEDNGLVVEPYLAGPGVRRSIALDHRRAHLQVHPDHDDRHWLRHVFATYLDLPATGDLFAGHNPVWLLAPSADGARLLLQGLQAIEPETGEIRHDFTDPAWDTRFLGDLYQDLSDDARARYALLQTPIFVEEFILDRTLDPAIATFGLAEVTALDPTCGSGHFLLGAFARLHARWSDAEPATNPTELVRRALDAIAGIDLNPFAAAIARFRLLVAALCAGGHTRLADAPAYPIHVAVADSLLHGDLPGRLPGTISDEDAAAAAHGYATEDIDSARALLSRSWSAVVGNPPYIIVRDPALNALYRRRFPTCRGKYSLGVPFTERFFQLARHDTDPERCGFVGMITANSFMKREMGKKLVEGWVPEHDLTHVIDTSGAYIPGHGTPTVILFGRNRRPVATTVRAVMGIRGEPSTPAVPEKGLVWSSISALTDQAGSSSAYVSVVELLRIRLAKHPWSIGGGGAADLKNKLDDSGRKLSRFVASIGPVAVPGTDEAYVASREALRRYGVLHHHPLVLGEDIRDMAIIPSQAVFPYDESSNLVPYNRLVAADVRWLWPRRSVLASYVMFGKSKIQRGVAWYEWGYLIPDRLRTPLSITFAEIATHNHFVLDRGGRVFKQTAPVIKLPPGAGEARHLELLAVLNSSTGCFWLQQVCHNKGRPGAEAAAADEPYEFRFVHDSTKLKAFPLPLTLDATTAALLDRLALDLAASTPAAIAAAGPPTAERLAEAHARYDRLRAEMIAAQERLDWEAYRAYGLVDGDLTTGDQAEPSLALGERAFEIVLARRVAAGEEETSWFTRHRSTPITEPPAHWPDDYRQLVARRIELIEADRDIGLIEKPEHKRRWAAKPWDDQVRAALRSWLLDRLEDPGYWPQPAAVTTTARLATAVRTDADFLAAAALYTGQPDVDVARLIAELVRAEGVAYLAALRYSDAGLRKHAAWLGTWDLQRREDAGDDVGTIAVPPKYTKTDFTGAAWAHRGKLDVAKERFITYPGAEKETDASLPVGWAGWDHLARARALATWYVQDRSDARPVAHLTPLLAGLDELVPWLLQWHDDPDSDPALDRAGTQVATLVDAECRALGLARDQLAAWRPAPSQRGRRPRSIRV